MGLTFWIGALGIPAALLIGNALIRAVMGMSQSPGTDVALMFTAFDATVLIQSTNFMRYVWSVHFKQSFIAIFVLLMLCDLMFWVVLLVCERKIGDYHEDYKLRPNESHFPFASYFGSMFLPALMIFSNVTPFVYGWPT
jgi:hypothetical protein